MGLLFVMAVIDMAILIWSELNHTLLVLSHLNDLIDLILDTYILAVYGLGSNLGSGR